MNDDTDKKGAFIIWLSANCPEGMSSQKILKSLKDGSQKCVRSKYSDKSFWAMSTVEEFTKATEKLLSVLKWSRFIVTRRKSFLLLEKSFEVYKRFLSEWNTIQETENTLPVEPELEKRDFPTIDRTEAIHLIDTYINTVKQKGDLESVEKEVSMVFRNRALKFDLTIDESFRDIPFVDGCFSDIAKLFQNSDEENCHPLLRELVNLYIKDPKRYAQQSTIVSEELQNLGVLSTQEKCSTNDQDNLDVQADEATNPSIKTIDNYTDTDSTSISTVDSPKESSEGIFLIHRVFNDSTESQYFRADEESFYRWLREDQNLAEATSAEYVSAIHSAEDYASKKISFSCKLFCDNKEIIEFTANALFDDFLFKRKNEQQHNRLFTAIKQYLKYKQVPDNNGTEVEHTVIEPIIGVDTNVIESVLSTLKEHFVYGFNISSPIEIMRFHANYEADHQEQCALDEETLKTVIAGLGVSYKGKVYVVDQEIKERIRSIILNRIQLGDSIFYFDEIYNINEEWLYDGHIVDSEMLKEVLESLFPQYRFKDRFFIANNNRMTELKAVSESILHSWGEQVLNSFTELKERLPFIPLDKIRYSLSYGKEFTWNSIETYARKDLVVVSDEQIKEIVKIVTMKCDQDGSVTFDELPLEDIATENYDLSETALYEIIFSFLPECFSRNGKVISRTKEQQHDTVAAIQQYCKQHEICTMAELQQIMQDVEGTIRYPVVIEAASAVMVRVSQDNYVADDTVQFDILGIDSALEDVVVGNGIGLKEVTTFGTFPFCGYSWNHFVLESYCRRFSAKYRYACITPNSQNAGAIIRKNSDLSYHDIMAEALARSGVILTEKNAFDYLITTGFLIRRRYNNMNSLLKKAAVLREGGD